MIQLQPSSESVYCKADIKPAAQEVGRRLPIFQTPRGHNTKMDMITKLLVCREVSTHDF